MTLALKTAAAVAGFLLVAPAAAVAQNAITTDDTPLRAGPGPDFPRLAIIPEDAGVRIHGCIAGYDWCDVSWRYERGWVRGRNLSYVWNGRYVIIEDWGPIAGAGNGGTAATGATATGTTTRTSSSAAESETGWSRITATTTKARRGACAVGRARKNPMLRSASSRRTISRQGSSAG